VKQQWIKDAKGPLPGKRKGLRPRRLHQREESGLGPENSTRLNDSLHSPEDLSSGRPMSEMTLSPPNLHSESLIVDITGPGGALWLPTIYKEGFEAIFGSWMGRFGCPFM
jgi:hypothetical protein